MVRKRGSKVKGSSGKKPKTLKRADGRIKKWDKVSDIPMDDEDQFHSTRDKILLDGNNDDDDDGDEEEVFSLNGISDDDEDEEHDYADEPAPSKASMKKSNKGKGKGKDKDNSESDSASEEEESWGQSRAAYYSSNAANLESDDEEGHELEEQEAKRLQAKARQDMTDDDFGFNDPIDLTGISDDEYVFSKCPVVQQLPGDDAALIRHFEKVDPESLALARDWTDTAYSISKTQQHLKTAEEADGPNSPKLGMMHLYYQTLLTYGSTLAFYIHLRSSQKHAQHPEALKSHPIMSRLVTLKQSLITMEDMDFGNSDSELDDDESDFDEAMDAQELWGRDKDNTLEANELSDLLDDAESLGAASIPKIRIKPLQAPPITDNRVWGTSVVFDLVEPEFTSSRGSTKSRLDPTDGFGEATELQHADAADKSARKKSLRFHTSKIESASARRRGARNDAVGGDDDIPYRERKKTKDLRLAEEAKKRLERQGGADLDDVDPEADKMDVDGEQDGDGYYELVKKAAKEKKEKRKAEHEARSTRVDYAEEETSGPRSVSRAILKNRGLTPHRPKSVRNPREKKVSSQKAVYKGGDAARYEGERSSVRLG
ncbi:hypothetical protein BDZ89DRAFT_1061643 [Hymenopellis radicata]|nr:hypothetical protein BDZ89DRAFT_1061643 [Hymenopellis radicata]